LPYFVRAIFPYLKVFEFLLSLHNLLTLNEHLIGFNVSAIYLFEIILVMAPQ